MWGLRRVGGLAVMLGGVLTLIFALIYYAFTHGSTQQARHDHDLFFGLEGAEWCRIQVIEPGLLLGGVIVSFGPFLARLDRRGRAGFLVACAALAARLIALILQCWVVHPDRDFESAPALIGFLLGVVAVLPLGIGLTVLGRAAQRGRIPAASQVLVVGVLVIPTAVVAFILQDAVSTGGLAWDLTLTAVHVPLALAWLRLGWVVWSQPQVAAAG